MKPQISTDTRLTDQTENFTPFVRRTLESIYPDVEGEKKAVTKKLETYCETYPEVPVYKNLLSRVYILRGDHQKAYKIN